MGTLNNIFNLLDKSGHSQKELADYLGVSKNRITDWKAGRLGSYTKYIPQIAEFLGVTVDVLYAPSEDRANQTHITNSVIGNHNQNCCNGGTSTDIGEIEQELFRICSKMTMKQKNALLSKAYELLES